MLASVKASYSKFQQITFDERFVVSREHGDTLADTMSIVIEGLRTTLYPVWPRIREIECVTFTRFRQYVDFRQ